MVGTGETAIQKAQLDWEEAATPPRCSHFLFPKLVNGGEASLLKRLLCVT